MVGYLAEQGAARRPARLWPARTWREPGALDVGRKRPRDLAAVRDGLAQAEAMRALLAGDRARRPRAAATPGRSRHHDDLVERFARRWPDCRWPARRRLHRAGYAPELDRAARPCRDESRRRIAGLQSRYAEETGIACSKVRHNNVLGYYIEVTATHAPKLTAGDTKAFIHRQTLANAVRFTTVELSRAGAEDRDRRRRALAIELQLFEDLVGEVTTAEWDRAGRAGAGELDVARRRHAGRRGAGAGPVIEETTPSSQGAPSRGRARLKRGGQRLHRQ